MYLSRPIEPICNAYFSRLLLQRAVNDYGHRLQWRTTQQRIANAAYCGKYLRERIANRLSLSAVSRTGPRIFNGFCPTRVRRRGEHVQDFFSTCYRVVK